MNPTITEKLNAIRQAIEATAPLERENERFFELAELRQRLEFDMRTTPDYTDAQKYRDELFSTHEEFSMLVARASDLKGRRESAWTAAIMAFDNGVEAFRAGIVELAGQPVEIAGEIVEPPSAKAAIDRLVAVQVSLTNGLPTMRRRRNIALAALDAAEAAVDALNRIAAERKALEAAKAAYYKALASKAA